MHDRLTHRQGGRKSKLTGSCLGCLRQKRGEEIAGLRYPDASAPPPALCLFARNDPERPSFAGSSKAACFFVGGIECLEPSDVRHGNSDAAAAAAAVTSGDAPAM